MLCVNELPKFNIVGAHSLFFIDITIFYFVASFCTIIRTLSSTVKWILQAQELSDILLSASKSGGESFCFIVKYVYIEMKIEVKDSYHFALICLFFYTCSRIDWMIVISLFCHSWCEQGDHILGRVLTFGRPILARTWPELHARSQD